MLLRKEDLVLVIRGEYKGTQGKVLAVNRQTGHVTVEGVNKVYKHVRRSAKNPQGGRLSREMPIDASNVMLICPQTGKRSRLGVRFLQDGSKERYAKASGVSLGTIAPARAAHAGKK
ncbi:MAG: 50S ribosomal protein L24 [Pirellulaceae bacterium]|nr:50S ribosomal protein L24 [Pirellulaceae bacterium]